MVFPSTFHRRHPHAVRAALDRRLRHHARDVLHVEKRPAVQEELLRDDALHSEFTAGMYG